MPPINPSGRLPRLPPQPPPPPIQFENRTPESFQRNGFVNTTPASALPNPHQAPLNPNFINTTARDYRPELRIDTTVGGGRPVGQGSPSHHGDTTLSAPIGESTLSAFSEESGRRAPMHPGLGGSSSGNAGSSSRSLFGTESPINPFHLLTPPPPSTTPGLSSPGSSATHPLSPYTPRSPMSDDGRIFDENSPSRLISRSPSFEIPEPMFFESNLTGPITRPSSPDRSTAPSPSTVAPPSPSASSTSSASSESIPLAQTRSSSGSPSPGFAPTPGAFNWDSPGGFYAPTPAAYRSPTPFGSAAPTPGYAPTPGAYGSPSPGGYGYAPTPGGYASPTPGVEAAAAALMNLHSGDASRLPSHAPTPGTLGSGATTPRAFDAPTPGAPGTPSP